MSAKYSISNYFGDKLVIYENTVELEIKRGGFMSGTAISSMWGGAKFIGKAPDEALWGAGFLGDDEKHLPPGRYTIINREIKHADLSDHFLRILTDNDIGKDISEIYRCEKRYRFYLPISNTQWDSNTYKKGVAEAKSKTTLLRHLDSIVKTNRKKIAEERESHRDYEKAIEIYKNIGENKEATRVRKLAAKQGSVKVDQTVVHGDYVDDRDTIVKDSVLNRSNVGGGSSKMQELTDLTEMKKEGLIDDAEFKQMKKEILGK